MKSYCKRCRRWLNIAHFNPREDRPGYYAFCKSCMKHSPVFVTVGIYPDEVQVLEKPSRTVDYPNIEDRGFGSIRN